MNIRIFLLLTSMICYAGSSYAENSQLSADAPIRPVKLLTIEDPSLEAERTFPALVKASERTELAFRVSGELKEIAVKEGEIVKKGQVLARLDPTDFDVSLQRFEAEYLLAKKQFNRIKTMLERKLVSQAQYDQKAAELSINRAALRQARLNRKYTEITAPYDGEISQIVVENFQNIQAKQPVLILQSNDELDIEIQLSESIISMQARPDALEYKADVSFDAIPQQTFKAGYRERTTEADAATGTYTVTLSMKRPESLQIYPGMTANVTVDFSQVFIMERSRFALPVSAVFSAEDQPLNSTLRQIWKFNPETQKVSRADVEVGELTSAGLEIKSGLKSGETVVTAGANYLREGMKVRPLTRERGL